MNEVEMIKASIINHDKWIADSFGSLNNKMIKVQKQQDIKNKYMEGKITFLKSNYENLDRK